MGRRSRENQLRQIAKRRGFELRRSSVRDHLAIGYGLYALFPLGEGKPRSYDPDSYTLTLDEVARALDEPHNHIGATA